MNNILESELEYLKLLSRSNKFRFAKTGNDFLAAVRDINQLRSMCLGYGELDAAQPVGRETFVLRTRI